MSTETSSAAAPKKVMTVDEFFAEAKRLDLKASDIFPGVVVRLAELDRYRALSRVIVDGNHLALSAEHFLDALMTVHELEIRIAEEDPEGAPVEAVKKELERAKEVRIVLWRSLANAIGGFRARAEKAEESMSTLMSLQEVWNLAGGNPGIKPTRADVVRALNQLDDVCDEADALSQSAFPSAR